MANSKKKRKSPILWMILAFGGILAFMIISNYRSSCVYEFSSPGGGVSRLTTIGKSLVAISVKNEIYVWDWGSLPGHPKVKSVAAQDSIALSVESQVKILAVNNGVFTLSNIDDDKEPGPLYLRMEGSFVDLQTSLNAKYAVAGFVVSDVLGRSIKLGVIEADSGSISRFVTKSLDENSTANSVGVSNDGGLLAAAGKTADGGWIFVADAESKEILWEQSIVDCEGLNTVTFSPDGQMLYAAKSDRYICIFDAGSGKVLKELEIEKYKTPPNNPQSISCISVSSDNQLLAAATVPASRVYIWDAKNGSRISVINPGLFTVKGLAFSPDSSLLATGDLIGKNPMRVWKIQDGR